MKTNAPTLSLHLTRNEKPTATARNQFVRASWAAMVQAVLVLLAGNAWSREIYVQRCAAAGGDGSLQYPFATLIAAHASAAAGDVISVEAGPYPETFTLT